MERVREKIEQANELALTKMNQAQPIWTDIKQAYEVFENFDKYTLLHAGPPITWEKMSGPMRGAVIASLLYEELAETEEEAIQLVEEEKITFEPCHHFHAVGPMTGVTSYSMPLYVVENKAEGNKAYSTINEGAGDVIRFGAYSENTVKRLKWIEEILAPALKKLVNRMGGMNLTIPISQAVHMGDELHMRNGASTAVFLKAIMPHLVEVVENHQDLKDITKFLTTNNDQFFLNLAMCASKVTADAGHGIEHSTIVTAMARNGVEIGIRVSGLGDRWFTGPAAEIKGLYFSGYTEEDANRDIGDSAIMETAGLGGFAMAAAPAIVQILGAGTYEDALEYTNDMYEICYSENVHYTIPNMDFRGTPTGIDLRKVVETGITPVINTAIASKEAGVGMIGAGVAIAPLEMFEKALIAYAEKVGI